MNLSECAELVREIREKFDGNPVVELQIEDVAEVCVRMEVDSIKVDLARNKIVIRGELPECVRLIADPRRMNALRGPGRYMRRAAGGD